MVCTPTPQEGPFRELCEVNAAARRFLDQYNVEHETDWEPLGPDIRIVVSPCAVPLRSAWTIDHAEKSVLVSCRRTNASAYERKWELSVQVVGETLQQHYFIQDAARRFVRQENSKRHAHWIALEPSGAPMVPKCAIPLSVQWQAHNYGQSVYVVCSKAVKTAWGKERWRVKVPVV